jgi:CRISPR-associated endoribonuclease Cas6/Csy4 subtype I-F
MYYRDIVFLAQAEDVQFFMNQVLTLVHDKHAQLNLAVSFPQWQDAKGVTTVAGGTPQHANPGKVLRLFSAAPAALGAMTEVLGIRELELKQVVFVTPTQAVPETARGVAFYRYRGADKLRAQTGSAREAFKAQLAREAASVCYLPLVSQGTGQRFSLFIGRVVGALGGLTTNVTSFGVSRKSELCFLPDF